MFCYCKEIDREYIGIWTKYSRATNFKIQYNFFMDIKKSNFLENCFKLFYFSLKIFNENAGKVVTLVLVLSAQARKPTGSQSEARLY